MAKSATVVYKGAKELTHGLSNESVDAEATDKVQVELLAAREELGANVQVRAHDAGPVEEDLADVNRSRMRVVEAEAIKHAGEELDVARHVRPEPGVRGGPGAVAELDAVAPNDELAAEVGPRRGRRKVYERVCVPDPPVVREDERERVVLLRSR